MSAERTCSALGEAENGADLTRLSDEALFLAYRDRGSQASFNELIQRQQDFAFRIAKNICRNSALAEEAVQNAFLRIMRPDCQFQPSATQSFRVWFAQVVANSARMHVRGERRTVQRQRSARYKSMLESDRGSNAPTVPVSAADVAEDERRQLRQSLQTAMAGLDEDLRLPIMLHYVEGLNQNEVGRIIGVSQSPVARRIAKGLAFMRKKLTHSGVVLSAAMIPQTLSLLSTESAPASLRQSLLSLSSRPLAVNVADESLRGGLAYSRLKLSGATLLIVAIAVGGLWSIWPATPPTPTTSRAANTKESSESSSNLWFFDFNHGKPTELRYLSGNWEHRSTGGTNDSGALLAIPDENGQPAAFALPENCPPNVVVSYDLIRQEQALCGLSWTWALEPIGRPEKFKPEREFRLSAENVLVDGRRHRVNVHFSLDTGLIFVSVSDKPLFLQPFSRRTIETMKHFTPAFVASGMVFDNLTVRAATATDETRLKELWTKVENFEVETYDFFDGVNYLRQNLGGNFIFIAEDVHRDEYISGKPEKDIPKEFNLAREFKPIRKNNFETLCFWPNSAPKIYLLRFDYFPENAKAAESTGISCHFLADNHSMSSALKADKNFQTRGSPLKSITHRAADKISSLEIGRWHELEFFLTQDLVVCLANGRPWFAAKDPRAIAQPEGLALFFGGHCRVDNLRGRDLNPKDEARLEALKKNFLMPTGENPPTK